jgi:predicted transcriptional regulator
MSTKEAAIEVIRAMPDDVSAAELVERLEFRLKVEEGLRQLDNGEGITHEEARARLAKWLA